MEIDGDISRWILEFILRQPHVSDRTVNLLSSALPLPAEPDSRLQKSILLRSIQSEIDAISVSEKILDRMELIEEVDQRNRTLPVSDAMKEAYRAVALECTVKFLHGRFNDYSRAVERVWRGRIRRMEESEAKSRLLTEELVQWGRRVEAALHDNSERESLMEMNTRNDALRKVRAYLAEAWEKMGPSFIEVAAKRVIEANSCGELILEDVGVHSGPEHVVISNVRATEDAIDEVALRRGKVEKLKQGASMEKQLAVHRRTKGGVKIADTEERSKEVSRSECSSLPSPEVNKVQDALKSSSLELQALVKDPLPDVLRLAGSLVSNIASPSADGGCPEAQIRQDVNVSVSFADNPAMEVNCLNKSSNHRHNQYIPSLMERNSSARTYEWDDSADGSPDGASDHWRRSLLSSPKRKAISPLKKALARSPKCSRRRKIKRWSSEEEETLRKAVQRFGKGNWKLILDCYRTVFEERTEVDLKDKWRNMTRY